MLCLALSTLTHSLDPTHTTPVAILRAPAAFEALCIFAPPSQCKFRITEEPSLNNSLTCLRCTCLRSHAHTDRRQRTNQVRRPKRGSRRLANLGSRPSAPAQGRSLEIRIQGSWFVRTSTALACERVAGFEVVATVACLATALAPRRPARELGDGKMRSHNRHTKADLEDRGSTMAPFKRVALCIDCGI